MLPSSATTLSFFLVALLLSFTPGPDNLFVLAQSASQGRTAGIFVVLGLCTGLLVHTAAVAFGLAAIFAKSAAAFSVLKFAGAAYLTYLAWQAFCAPADKLSTAGQRGGTASARLYFRGVVMNLTNPKVLLFFLAFLPQFVDSKRGSVAIQVGWFGLVFIVATLLAFGTIAQVSGYLGERLGRSARAQRFLNRVSAAVFSGLAARLVLT